jgi:nucleotide-binding universal stress UspA family protein
MKVLLAIDFSKGSQHVLEEAAARPWPTGTEFLVLNVLDMRSFGRFSAALEDAKREAAKFVKAAAEKLIRSGHLCASEVTLGTPRSAIAGFAKQWKADLVMVGSRGLGAIARFLLGSVAQGVLHTASCSVEIVRPTASGSPASSRGLKILLPTDGSDFSMAAAKSVASRPWPAGSKIKVVAVEEMPVFENQTTAFPLAAVYPASLLEELMESARNHARDAFESARKSFAGSALELADGGSLPVGDARSVILEVAQKWPADLIVLGSHGRHGMDRVLMGSVSEAVAIHAACSVEIVRADRQEQSEKAK